ncbi:MAG: CPBP family intramembrane metalloprotease, partial [Phycisphaerales bacterium]
EEIQEILHKLYDPAGNEAEEAETDGAEPPRPAVDALTDADRNLLVGELDWFGRLALNPPGEPDAATRAEVVRSAVRVFHVLAGAMGGAAVVGLAGFVGLIVLLVLACIGNLRDGMEPGGAHHGLYAETFAVWMVLFLCMQLVAGAVALALPKAGMMLLLAGFFASLVALVWPVIRGASWGSVRRDIGWTLGRAPGLEPLIGVGGYAMAIPLLTIGVLCTLVLIAIQTLFAGEPGTFESTAGPAHPVILELAGGWWPKVQILLLAAIAAPIVEETMFRGVLYRHLRDATGRMGIWGSVLISATINGFIFAAIHPQGWVAIPALMALAYSFIILREWRGTVIPSIIVHGISNGLVMSMVIALLGA